jgi:hypothetical protein
MLLRHSQNGLDRIRTYVPCCKQAAHGRLGAGLGSAASHPPCCQPTTRWTGQRPDHPSDPAPAPCPGRPGSRRQTASRHFLFPISARTMAACFEVDPTSATYPSFAPKRTRSRFPDTYCAALTRTLSPSRFFIAARFRSPLPRFVLKILCESG